MPKTICVKCQLEYRNIQTGINIIEIFQDPPQPYLIRAGDLYQCPKCKHKIITGVSSGGIYHHEPKFKNYLSAARKGSYIEVMESPIVKEHKRKKAVSHILTTESIPDPKPPVVKTKGKKTA